MKIIYLHQYFKTPKEGGAIRSYYIAKALTNAGFEVEMITSHNKKKYACENIEGIKVHYLPVFYDNKLGKFSRVIAFIKFTWKCYFKAKSIWKKNKHQPCLCYATSTPLTIGWIALRLKRKIDLAYFFEVRDLWPQAPIEMGAIKNKWLKKYLFRLENKIYKQAQKIIALSPGMQTVIEVKTTPEKVVMVPNMADTHFFASTQNQLYKSPKSFVISYLGTVGPANHLDYLLAIAQMAQEKNISTLHFQIIGNGKCLDHIQERAKSLNNVSFHSSVNKNGVKKILEGSDATYTSFLQKPVLTTCSPNKFFDSLAAGKLTIVNTKGWLQELVENHQCGFYADPTQPQAFIELIQPFLENERLLVEYQENARKLAITQFDRNHLTQKMVKLINGHFYQ